MDNGSPASDVHTGSVSLANNRCTLSAPSVSPSPERSAEEFQATLQKICAETHEVTRRSLRTVCLSHSIACKEPHPVLDLFSKFQVRLSEFEPGHQDILLEAQKAHSAALLAVKELFERIDHIDADVQEFGKRSDKERIQLEDAAANAIRQAEPQNGSDEAENLPGPEISGLECIGNWVDSPPRYSEIFAIPTADSFFIKASQRCRSTPSFGRRSRSPTPYPNREDEATQQAVTLSGVGPLISARHYSAFAEQLTTARPSATDGTTFSIPSTPTIRAYSPGYTLPEVDLAAVSLGPAALSNTPKCDGLIASPELGLKDENARPSDSLPSSDYHGDDENNLEVDGMMDAFNKLF